MSDPRWSGGIANREWQRGARPAPVTGRDEITGYVRQYLADCRTHRKLLDPRHHPTEDGALKTVFHRGHAQEEAVRAAYRQLTATVLTCASVVLLAAACAHPGHPVPVPQPGPAAVAHG
jgi:hypothetical protein